LTSFYRVTSKDGNVRATIVRVPESQWSNKLLRRSVKHLFTIVVQQEASPNNVSPGTSDSSSSYGRSDSLIPSGQIDSSTSDSTPPITQHCRII